jgi:hypothetical protein
MMTSWSDLYRQLWMHAARSRGTRWRDDDELDHASGPSIPEWPRTTVGDVVAIVMMVDPLLGSLPVRPGGYGVTRLWQTAVIELESLAAIHPGGEYSHNRTFWSTLLTVVAYLETRDAPLPHDDTWDALRAELAARPTERNASGPTTRTITEGSVEKMWDSQQAELIAARGFDLREPTGSMLGRPMKVPRTTNADVVQLADYWSHELERFEAKVHDGTVSNSMGLDGQRTRWTAIMADVDHLARSGQPDDVYPKNHELWREALGLATNLAVWNEVPSPYELAIASAKQATVDLPDRLAAAAGTVAHAIGDIAHEAGAGLLSSLGKPMLVGGGVLLGLYLLLRPDRDHGREHEAR